MPRLLLTALLLATLAGPALARVRLITLPPRERVEVQLDHPEVTLVEEVRVVPLVQGTNQIDFAWGDAQIDPETIVFRVMEAIGDDGMEVRLIAVSKPPNENALTWQVFSTAAGSARVRISYLLGGLNESFAYRAVASPDEQTLTLSQYARITNFAAEQFGDTDIFAGIGDAFTRPLGSNQTIEVLLNRFEEVQVDKTYTADAHAHGYLDRAQDRLNVPMHYVLHNDQEHGLGQGLLPYGKVRIFQQTAPPAPGNGDGEDDAPQDDRPRIPSGGSAFLGEDWGQQTPREEAMRLYVGLAQDVQVRRQIADRDVIDRPANVVDQHVVLRYTVQNFKDTPVTLNIVEQIEALRQEAGIHSGQPASWRIGDRTTLEGDADPEHTNQNTLTMPVELPARQGDEAEELELLLHLVFENQW